jgi:simple sugar transport system substrate-binding protein
MGRKRWQLVVLFAVLALVITACGKSESATTTTAGSTTTAAPTTTAGTTTTAAPTTTGAEQLVFGMILVGPENDRGWSQANFEAGKYLEEKLGARMISLDKVNTADRPETSVDQVVDQMVAEGAQLIFATSDDMRDGIELAAERHPDVPMIWTSGDSAWAEAGEGYRPDLTNLGNVMGRMEFGKMIGGCAAALTTETGKIGYLGPLINAETRRLANSAYLGARYCWETYRGNDAADLAFTVTWIGFWFEIPGVTLSPTQVANDFFDSGHDVVISGIDTTNALVRAGQRAEQGEKVWAISYDFKDGCAEAPSVCLGVPYFNWGPAYLQVAQSVIDGTFAATWQWNSPDWADINNADTSAVGFVKGEGLSVENGATLDEFIAGLADGSINLFIGPLNYQDGTPYLAADEVASDVQIWFTQQLLEGMVGASASG